MKRVILMTLAATCAAISVPAAAQFAKTEDAIKYRQSAMFIQGQHVGRLGAMAAGRVPYDAAVAVSNAEVVAEISRLPWAGFGPGTEGGKAKPEIWKEQTKFKELSEKLMSFLTALDRVEAILNEEREALRVKALDGLGRHEDAQRAAAQFHARFPHSVFLPTFERLKEADR